jgi:hypothetical protein
MVTADTGRGAPRWCPPDVGLDDGVGGDAPVAAEARFAPPGGLPRPHDESDEDQARHALVFERRVDHHDLPVDQLGLAGNAPGAKNSSTVTPVVVVLTTPA